MKCFITSVSALLVYKTAIIYSAKEFMSIKVSRSDDFMEKQYTIRFRILH